MTPQTTLLTTREVATRYRVHPATVTRWARDGKLPSRSLPSGRLRFVAEEVEAFLEAERGAA